MYKYKLSEMKRILIVGAGGQIGTELVPHLQKHYGHDNVVAADLRDDMVAKMSEVAITEKLDILDINAFEAKVLSDRGILKQIPSRYRSTYFSHTFTGGYTAGYYSYIWAEVLDADAFEAFVETGDIFNQEVADKYRTEILERGSEVEAMDLYVNFRGKQPGIDPLLKNRGLK